MEGVWLPIEEGRMSLSPTGRSALVYITRFGWHVGPTRPGTKLPETRFLRRGHLDATNDPEQAARWWSAEPDAGVLVSCAASGLVVLDADLYKEDCAFPELESRLGTLPDTPRALTQRGGVHYYFRDTVGHYVNPCAGAESKHEGYVIAAATAGYRWDLGAHVLDTPLAELPDAWLAHLTVRPKTSGPVLASSGLDALDSWIGRAFEAAGWIGDAHPDGRRNVRCPWLREHSDGRGDGRDSSAVIFPKAEGRTLGGFRCAHAHCAARGWREVVDVLPPRAKWAADQATVRERNARALQQIDAIRRAG
jgi:Bifunctional DNA primase/polymerase, N-terminal